MKEAYSSTIHEICHRQNMYYLIYIIFNIVHGILPIKEKDDLKDKNCLQPGRFNLGQTAHWSRCHVTFVGYVAAWLQNML